MEPSLLFSSFVVLYLLYQASKTFYDVYLGPMSKFPGPKLWAATNFPIVRMLWNGEDASAKLELHRKYGHVVRISPTELSYCDAQAWKDIYGHRTTASKKSFPKDPKLYIPAVNGAYSIIAADDPNHTRLRRVLAHAFSDKALKEQEPLLKHWADLLIEKLMQRSTGPNAEPVNMVSWYNFTTFDIMADLTFAEPLYMLEGGAYSPWVKTIFDSIKAGNRLFALRNFAGMTFIIRKLMPDSLRKKQIDHFNYSAERVDRRLARKDNRPDLWNLILKRVGTEGELSLPEMHAISTTFMTAGTETTATLLSGLTYYLLKNPDIMARLVDEIRTAFPTRNDISIETLQRLPYLHACIEEGLRMYPQVPTGLPRKTPVGGAPICGDWVPGNITVSVSQWSAYSNEANFHRANEFIPERWMGDERFVNDDKAAFQPFSTGPRNCLGRNLAYHEVRLLLSEVLWNFDLELDGRSENWTDQAVFLLWEKVPLWVTLKPVAR